MRHRKEAGEGEVAREDTLHPDTQQVAVPEKAGTKPEDLAAKLEAEVAALWEENVEAPAGDKSKAQAAVVKEDAGGAASTETKLENKAADAPAVAVEEKSVNENVGKVEASEAHSGEREADKEKSKAERKKKSKYGRVSGLPTNCDKFTLPLSPSMLIDLDHAEYFDDYKEVDINDAKRYKILRKIGKGQQGMVVGAIDLLTGEEVAIKKVTNFLGFYNGTALLKEVVVMQNLMGADGMVQLRATLPTAAHVPATLSALYIVMERMDVDMAKTIEVTSKMELLTQSWLIYQMISALKNLHTAGVVHQDISIWNIMTRRDCTVKLVDFGYAAPIRRKPPTMPYSHVEVTVPLPAHPGGGVTSPELDVWYTGMSILAMTSGEYYFRADGGRTDDKLISAWLAEYGEPPADMLPWFKPDALALLETARREAKEREAAGTPPPHTLQSLFPAVNPAVIRLTRRMMNWHLTAIPTAGELLRDPLFDDLYPLMGPKVVPERYGPALLKYYKVQEFDSAGFLSAIYNKTATTAD